jgi:hypothetical protein
VGVDKHIINPQNPKPYPWNLPHAHHCRFVFTEVFWFFASSDALGFLLPKRMLATKVQIVAKEQELETNETKDYQKD